jgi:membrane-associated protease RseP (regulator of RpoE activity)
VLWDAGIMRSAGAFTATLLGILLAHEFGHYIAARAHRVPATLPFFIPMPVLSPFGTMGAVIKMKGQIGTRRAQLDIGAYGPLAGLALAIPLYAWGASHSVPVTLSGDGDGLILGESILLKSLDFVFAPKVPAGQELMLNSVAFAAWGGMFVTMVNLLPVGQLDAGHVAFALFGPRQNTFARTVHRAILVFFGVGLAVALVSDARAGVGLHNLGKHIQANLFWLAWFHVLGILGAASRISTPDEKEITIRMRVIMLVALVLTASLLHDASSGTWILWLVGLAVTIAIDVAFGVFRADSNLFDHPPAGNEPLGLGRRGVAIVTLLFFVLLFMPRPIGI